MKLQCVTIYAIILLTGPHLASQVTMTGGKGMLRLYEAETITAGDLYVNPIGTFFVTRLAHSTTLAKDYTINLGLTLGMSERFETFVHLVPYQSDQVHLIGPPGDAKIGVKMAFPMHGLPQFGIVAFADFPIARIQPLPYEPYSDDAIGYAFIGLLTLDFRHSKSPLPLKFTFNAGFRSHDSSKGIAGDTNQLMGGFGMKLAVRSAQIYTEVTGEIFINHPIDLTQNSLRWSGGYKFLLGGLIVDLGGDIELGGYEPSQSERAAKPRFLEDYADWKIIVGITHRWTLFQNWDNKVKQEQELQRQKEREIEELRKQREKVVEELQQYERRLRDEKKQDVPF
ncbi:hypothetical protein JXA02_05900 [candidate division KSB1 bacterium]|nr:hypothetical protein [candidate division KSB1 bacterium]RQW07661.1 MAG: hypothetical protein EH222_06805 [candidate division KSB1 bacterium]